MATSEPSPASSGSSQPKVLGFAASWCGIAGFVLLAIVGGMGPDIAPSGYYPDLMHYIPLYVLLALSVGFGLSAVRSSRRVDRVFGIAVLTVGLYMVIYVVTECCKMIG